MAESDDHLFERLLNMVEDMADAKPTPPPIPKQAGSKKGKELPFHRRLSDVNGCLLRTQKEEAPEELTLIVDQLCALCRTMEKPATLRCFSSEQLPKLSIGYNEMIESTLGHVELFLGAEGEHAAQVRADKLKLLHQAADHFKTMYRELNAICRAVKKDEKPAFTNFIDALGRTLEIVGYDESIMEVEKKKMPPPIPDGAMLPRHCRIAFQVADAGGSANAGKRLALSTQVKPRR